MPAVPRRDDAKLHRHMLRLHLMVLREVLLLLRHVLLGRVLLLRHHARRVVLRDAPVRRHLMRRDREERTGA